MPLRRRRAAVPAPARPAVVAAPPPPLPPVLPPPVVTLLGLAAAVVVLGGIRAAQELAAPIFLAFVLSIAVYPLQAWLRRLRLPGWLALTLTVLVTYAALTAFAGALLLSVLQFADQAQGYRDEVVDLVAQGEDLLLEAGVDQAQINDVISQVDINQAFSLALGVVQGVTSLLSNLVFVLALLFFVLIDAGGVHTKLAAVAALRPRAAEALHGFTHGVRQYLVVTAVFGFVVAALDVVLLMVLGVPLPLLWGLLAFLASFVPVIGLVVGLVPPVVIGLLDGGPATGLYVLIGYLVINNTIDNVVKPKFVGDAVGLSITVSFLSLVVWGFVLGPLGALLAIPASLLARALLVDRDPRRGWVGIMVGDEPPQGEDLRRLSDEAQELDRREGRSR
ncbi:AI-2E family transporter [Aquipuribacter hungaricus]|uniref:AI-2E family transporter n=2 Tax=Aquipuribacter hungaricus TaxID=545624 RepID=A0ABV7WKX4_9MICO